EFNNDTDTEDIPSGADTSAMMKGGGYQ
ncbi:conjugal transfer protein TraQ, partial [Phocaeicola vulgatus]